MEATGRRCPSYGARRRHRPALGRRRGKPATRIEFQSARPKRPPRRDIEREMEPASRRAPVRGRVRPERDWLGCSRKRERFQNGQRSRAVGARRRLQPQQAVPHAYMRRRLLGEVLGH